MVVSVIWHHKYWDAVEQLYWTPSHLGLRSIPRGQCKTDVDFIQVPRERVKSGGTIYTRSGTFRSNQTRMRSLEETLNHVFDITFAIASAPVVARLLHQSAGIHDRGPFESLGSEVATRFGWGDNNVTQHDGFFVSPSSILAVELKLGSSTRPEQVLKYLAMVLLEESLAGKRPEVALLYVTRGAATTTFTQAGANADGHLPDDFLGQFNLEKLNPVLRELYQDRRGDLEALRARFCLFHLSWDELVGRCDAIVAGLDRREAGDATLARLLEGFAAAVRDHAGTGCAKA